ncbi:MAG: ribose-5-phosphate isomerase RpiA [Sedimentisphaerales bacterium]|jgi:ribose 5-phosphate isomerase A
MMEIERAKELAAQTAVEAIRDHSIVGLGTGSTLRYAIEGLGRRVRNEGLDLKAVTTSFQGQLLAREFGIPTINSMNVLRLDVAIDGADEVDPDGNLIKGLGAALTKEKIVAAMAEHYIIVVDQRKLVSHLGERAPVPVEVVPDALTLVERLLQKMGGQTTVRPDHSKAGPVVTDLGNLIIDVKFPRIEDPRVLERRINDIPGVVDNGLFLGMVDEVIVGSITEDRPSVEKRSFKKRTAR